VAFGSAFGFATARPFGGAFGFAGARPFGFEGRATAAVPEAGFRFAVPTRAAPAVAVATGIA
jgi:hypothetical protein